jgi:predicted phosphoribosyltransferase
MDVSLYGEVGLMFEDRGDAGQQLAQALSAYGGREDVVVLGLPRGGIPVAFEVAQALSAPLDVFIVRKLGVPWNPELAMGAIASGGVQVMNDDVVRSSGVSGEQIERVVEQETRELEEREEIYRGARPTVNLGGKTVILVDDGLATGATMRAAVRAVRARGAAQIVVAVPTAPPETCSDFQRLVDETICLTTPRRFMGVGGSYRRFAQTTNDEVRELLSRAK